MVRTSQADAPPVQIRLPDSHGFRMPRAFLESFRVGPRRRGETGCRVTPLPVEDVRGAEQFRLQGPHLDESEADVFLLLFEIGNGLGKFRQLDEHTVEKIGHVGTKPQVWCRRASGWPKAMRLSPSERPRTIPVYGAGVSLSSFVISIIVGRNPRSANSPCAEWFAWAVQSTTRGTPRPCSQTIAASSSALATPVRRALSSTSTSWMKPASSRSSFHDCGSTAA